jgi:hypothetical protein
MVGEVVSFLGGLIQTPSGTLGGCGEEVTTLERTNRHRATRPHTFVYTHESSIASLSARVPA